MKLRDNVSEIEKKQMETIKQLQDKIKLRDFDVSCLKREIDILKRSLAERKLSIRSAIKELENIRRKETYNKISNVLVILNSSLREKQ